jgi:hypothetical protein
MARWLMRELEKARQTRGAQRQLQVLKYGIIQLVSVWTHIQQIAQGTIGPASYGLASMKRLRGPNSLRNNPGC